MTGAEQLSLFDSRETCQRVTDYIKDMLATKHQPSAHELVAELDVAIGVVARWDLKAVLASLAEDEKLTRSQQNYLRWLLEEDNLVKALRGEGAPDQEVVSSIDSLLQASRNYRNSTEFQEMIEFMGRFKGLRPIQTICWSAFRTRHAVSTRRLLTGKTGSDGR